MAKSTKTKSAKTTKPAKAAKKTAVKNTVKAGDASSEG